MSSRRRRTHGDSVEQRESLDGTPCRAWTSLVAPERAHVWHGSFCQPFLIPHPPHRTPLFQGGLAALSPSSSLCVPVVVAVFSPSLAIIELRVPELGCWGDGDLQWRLLPFDCAKDAPEWRRTSCFATWTFQCLLREVGGGWRSSLRVSHCSGGALFLWAMFYLGQFLLRPIST